MLLKLPFTGLVVNFILFLVFFLWGYVNVCTSDSSSSLMTTISLTLVWKRQRHQQSNSIREIVRAEKCAVYLKTLRLRLNMTTETCLPTWRVSRTQINRHLSTRKALLKSNSTIFPPQTEYPVATVSRKKCSSRPFKKSFSPFTFIGLEQRQTSKRQII